MQTAALDGKATPGQYHRDAGLPFVSGRYGFGMTSSRRGFETTDGGMAWNVVDVPEPIMQTNKVERRACGPIGCLAAGWLRVGWGETKKAPIPAVPPPNYNRTSPALVAPQLPLACEPIPVVGSVTEIVAVPGAMASIRLRSRLTFVARATAGSLEM